MFYKSGETRPSVWSQYNSLLCEYRRAFPRVKEELRVRSSRKNLFLQLELLSVILTNQKPKLFEVLCNMNFSKI